MDNIFKYNFFLIIGIRMIAVGVGAADVDELRGIMMNRNLEDIFFVNSFDDFPSIVQDLIETICSESEEPVKMQPAEVKFQCNILSSLDALYFLLYNIGDWIDPWASSIPAFTFERLGLLVIGQLKMATTYIQGKI